MPENPMFIAPPATPAGTESTEAVETPEDAQEATTDTTTEEDTTTASEDTSEPDKATGGGLDELPESWQREIKRLRAEAGKSRTAAQEKAAKEAREAALAEAEKQRAEAVEATKAEIADAVAKALGIKKDDAAELTPEQVIEKITKERDEAETARQDRDQKYRDLLLEVAVQDAASMHEARADRLLDSRSFMKTVRALDPDSDGYRAAVAEAVQKAVEADDDLKAVRKPTPPSVSGGTTVAGSKTRRVEDMSIDELIEAGFTKRR